MSSQTIAMTDSLYTYFQGVAIRETETQRELRVATQPMEMARMQISPEQGQFMAMLVRLMGASRALEIGVFTGYSALSVAMALPADGQLVACDVSETWTNVGRPFWQAAGVDRKIDLRIGPASETLATLIDESARFDIAFIDADKENYDNYYEACLSLIRPGGLIMIDNVLWHGRVADETDRER